MSPLRTMTRAPRVPAQVQKSAVHYTEAARDEIEMLQRIAQGPPERTAHCVQLLDSFDHRGPHGLHVCMVFEARGSAPLKSIISASSGRGGGCIEKNIVETVCGA